MASAAAVATDISKSPMPDHEQNDELGTTGTITSADKGPSTLPFNHAGHDDDDDDEDDEDDDIRPNPGRKRATSPGIFGGQDGEDDGDDGEGGLFGSEEEDDDHDHEENRNASSMRHLDNEDLQSGDEQLQQEEFSFLDVDLVRHPIPEPTDGEVR